MKAAQAQALARRASRLLHGTAQAMPSPPAKAALEQAWTDLALAGERAGAGRGRGEGVRRLAEALREASRLMDPSADPAEASEAMAAAEAALRKLGGRPA